MTKALHISGILNKIADVLSRCDWQQKCNVLKNAHFFPFFWPTFLSPFSLKINTKPSVLTTSAVGEQF
jgi:hypothetical protein